MKAKTYSIFGAGAAGLYTAWRLLTGKSKDAKKAGKLLSKRDTLELYDWGKYDFSKKNSGTREPGRGSAHGIIKTTRKNLISSSAECVMPNTTKPPTRGIY
jgi:hypothetical protein